VTESRKRDHSHKFGSSDPAMSTIGSATGLGIAGSIVGSSRPESVIDRAKAASAEQKAVVDLRDSLVLEDVADPEFGSDRDADGRLLYRRPDLSGQAAAEEAGSGGPDHRPADPSGDSGRRLDLEA